jgi:hypothetical protein
MEKNNVAEQPIKTAGAGEQPVEKSPVSLTPETAEAMAKALEEATALAEQKAEEAANYKRGMIKAKAKLKDAGLDEEEPQPSLTKDDIAQIVREELKSVKPQEETETEKLRKNNLELINALRNRPNTPTSAGANADKPEPAKNTYWSESQIEELKRRGLDPEVVYRNMTAVGAPGTMSSSSVPSKV